ncbi:MAG: nucleotide disphospho-sugar-binding domain-containing protein [Eubacterium sp.]|nr:nucleotide disphospho-sugar-binding domain-containing protein [Eubacterium sp.]
MKILVVPMAAMAETAGPSSRCRQLVEGFRFAGIDVATCRAEDVNYKSIDGVQNYFLDIPMPMGLPKPIATRTFPIAQKLGITSKKTVNSFDQVLRFTGNLDYKYLKKSVESVRNAIQEYNPDIVYSEFNISAIVATKKEGIPLYTTVSYPTQHEYAHDSRLTGGLNHLLDKMRLPRVYSALQLFDWADKRFCPSIRELEPIEELKGEEDSICYCGTFKAAEEIGSKKIGLSSRDKILVYMGNGTVSVTKTLSVIQAAFAGSKYEVYLATSYLPEETIDNIHIAPRWDFSKLLDEALVYINHGGQNSIVDGLLHGVPQIMVPGKVFERKYNAESVADADAGIVIDFRDFDAVHVKNAFEKITSSDIMSDSSRKLGDLLRNAGGITNIIKL